MATVIVGCKLPHGIHAELAGKVVTLNGSNGSAIIGGFGITRDVDKDFMDNWLKAEAKNPIVANGLVFIAGSEREVEKAVSDREKEANGFEGVDPKKPGKGLKPAEAEE
ncbi:hypothetical protein [Pseudomonas sp. HS-18]|uniref:hypothetical protein n=1 Tax=Pseudomonas sp. HS-18 TaxID=2879114 RepID=UPI001CF071C1|nr:hypothetical protein [Pseudomonas sp. HS-18]UCL84503.1 hypothetical protein LDJ84_16120 [Pseudomonas sp. HS-18]